MGYRWGSTTAPFTTTSGGEPAAFALQQVDDDRFRLLTPFRYQPADGSAVIEVTPELLGLTDLASIPRALGWFASRHGRHTPAALLHDQLVTPDPGHLPPGQRVDRTTADALFAEALDALEVPPVRRWLMHAAVSFATRWGAGGRTRLGLVLWILAALAGTGLLLVGVQRRSPALVVVALGGPLVGALLWGRQYRLGVIAGYALWFAAVPTATSVGFYKLYEVTETGVALLRRVHPANRGEPVPGAVPYHER
jgi:hypothetical protein